MKSIIERLHAGINHFQSGGCNSNEFNKFFRDFKKVFTKELNNLNATEISFSKGHFYLSGFFKVNEQYYYFSLSDVRHDWIIGRSGKPEMLIRTAKHLKDYTGGVNCYVAIEPEMYKEIKRTFRLYE